MKMSYIAPTAIITGCLFILILFVTEINSVSRSTRHQKIKIAVNEWVGNGPIVYAQLMGIYEKYGLDVEIVQTQGQAESNVDFINKKFDAIGTVVSDSLLIRSNNNNGQIVLISDYSISGDVIIADKKIKSISELKNKKIGIDYLNSFSHLFAIEALKKYNVKEYEVEFKIIPYDKISLAIKNNEIAAGHTYASGKSNALNDGHHILFSAGEIPGLILDGVLFQDSFIKDNPERIKKFIEAFFEAQELMVKNPDTSSELIADYFKTNKDNFRKSYDDIHFVGRVENSSFFNQDGPSNKALQLINRYYSFYAERGQLRENENVSNIFCRGIYQ